MKKIIISLAVIAFACIQTFGQANCELQDNRTDKNIPDITGSWQQSTIHTADAASMQVIDGAVYEFSLSQNPFEIDQVGIFNKITTGVFNDILYSTSGLTEWQSDADGERFVTIFDTTEPNPSSGYGSYSCGYNPTSAVIRFRQKTGTIAIENHPTGATANCGESASFSVSAKINGRSNATWNYQWQRSDNGSTYTNISGATGSNLNLNGVQQSDFGDYFRCVVSVGVDNITSNAAQLSLRATDPPSGIEATRERCDAIVDVSWEWYQSNPSQFKIQVSTNNSTFTDLATVTGSKRKYQHTGVTRGQNYYYRIASYNNSCGVYGPNSDSEYGISPLPPSPPLNSSVTEVNLSGGGKGVQVTWTDNSADETGFIIARTFQDGTNLAEFEYVSNETEVTGTGTRTYVDRRIENCQPYEYKVYAFNTCSPDGELAEDGSGNELSHDIVIETAIDSVFIANALQTSKGYYSNKITLKWSVNTNSNFSFADRFKIYSRKLGADVVPDLIAIIDKEIRQYDHETADAGVLYEYFIVAAGDCGTGEITSFDISTVSSYINLPADLPQFGLGYNIGFRSPSGIVNGNITYAGGVAVPDVKVVVEKEEGNSGYALEFDGTDDYAEIASNSFLEFDEAISASVWVKPDQVAAGARTILEKSGTIKLTQNGTDLVASVGTESVTVASVFEANQYKNIFLTFDESTLTIYVNGEEAYLGNNTFDLTNDSNALYIGTNSGKTEFFSGVIDELRLHETVLTADEVLRSYGRLIKPSYQGLSAYWRFNEGTGPFIFDLSNAGGVFHQCDGDIFGATWSTDIPDGKQLGMAAYTDNSGNYSVSGVTYSDTGENFTVTPKITLGGAVHEFSPNQKVLFIGEGSSVQNEVDFTDVSSFSVTGYVRYKYDGKTEVGVPGVKFLLDGSSYIQDVSGFIETDADGFFDIQVPVGLHNITVQKNAHIFENDGRWPTTADNYDFQDVVTGLVFEDITTRTVIGRVVGGKIEGDKKVGFEKSTNNIGTATFKVIESNGKPVELEVNADESTGEFRFEIPPLRYTVFNPNKMDGASLQRGIDIAGNTEATLYFEQPSLAEDLTLDLRNVDILKYEIDSTQTGLTTYDVDSVSYHSKNLFVFRSEPQVGVFDGGITDDNLEFLGEQYYTIDNPDGTTDSVEVRSQFAHPVLFKANNYSLRIKVEETYLRSDVATPIESKVPVSDAEVEIFNSWGKGWFYDENSNIQYYNSISDAPGVLEPILLSDADGDTTYSFRAAQPEFNNDLSFSSQSFTKPLQITVKTKGNEPVYWPERSDPNTVKQAYIFGSVGLPGTSFVTQGPDIVDFILRDPPGDQSYAMLEKGSVSRTTSTFSNGYGGGVNLQFNIGMEITSWIGFGAGVVNTVGAGSTAGLDVSFMLNDAGETVTEYTATETLKTSDEFVGPDFDLFVGKSENLVFGLAQTLQLIPEENCGAGSSCGDQVYVGLDGSRYRVGSSLATFMNPTGETTVFAYTALHIKKTMIPNLELLRNNVLKNNPSYTSLLSADDPNYGKNNDDQSLSNPSTTTPLLTESPDDFNGPSYIFAPADLEETDSVRWLNQQIRLWEDQLSKNEEEKVNLVTANSPSKNLSYSGGTEFSFSETTLESETETFSWEVAESASYGTDFDFRAFGALSTLDLKISANFKQGGSNSTTEESTTTHSYTIKDKDPWDYFNVKVHQSNSGNGPVFEIADGGVTACPHEPEVVTEYYMPGTIVSARTLQEDKPRIEVDVPVLYNIPSDETGNFILNLHNDSENQWPRYYEMKLVDETNPNGLKLSIDGVGLGEIPTYLIPGGSTIQKVLEVEKGPFEYDYEDIKVVITSNCQNDPGSVYPVIADTVAISAFFLPQCTTPEILTPKNNWVANSNLNDTLNVQIGGFNINYSGFESVNLEYKSSSQSTWSVLETFHRDTTGMNDPTAVQIPRDNPVINYDWILRDINDGEYDLRATTKCTVLATGSLVFGESEIFSGLIDRVNPHPFGAPQPSDGILSAGEEIMIQFNEEINSGLLRSTNFSMSGVLNGGEIRHSASVRFEGDPNQYMEIPDGIDLSRKSFTIDFYLARDVIGEQIILSQGFTSEDALEIGFTSSNNVYFRLGDKVEVSEDQITDQIWRHYAFVYDHSTGTGSISLNGSADPNDVNNDFSTDYSEQGQILVGQAKYNKTIPLNARMHELRVWNKPLGESKISIIATKRLERNEFGLIGNWRMEESEGAVAEDHIRFRNASVTANWAVEPVGFSYDLSSDGYMTAQSIAYTAENNFTIEFWFKRGESADSVTLLSTGIGDGRDSNSLGWAIGTDQDGRLIIANNRDKIVATENSVLDNKWHHLALSVNRITSSNVFLDGEQVKSYDAPNWIGFGGSKIWIGARGWFDGAIENRDQFFNGSFDEIRIWSLAKTGEQVRLQRRFKLSGEERGLRAYYPFETYVEDSGVLIKSGSLANQQEEAKVSDVLMVIGAGAESENTPAINLPRPVKQVNFNYSANGDKIILSPTDPDSLLEGVILDITVLGVKDMNGNSMVSPVSWTAFYNKNSVLWENDEMSFDLALGESLTFETVISNVGGSVEEFRITNLPDWLTASPTTGTMNPLTSQKIVFTVDNGINLGKYAQDIYLSSDYGYEERMMVNLKVYTPPPSTWLVDESDYEYSMGLVGKVKIDGKFSQDSDDLVAAFVDDVCRGVTKMRYLAEFDQYFAYLNIYSNQVGNEEVELRVWDASDGIAYSDVDPSVDFVADSFLGTSSNPIIIETTGAVRTTTEFNTGWQWISFSVQSDQMGTVNEFMEDFQASNGDIIKFQGGFEQYDDVNGWIGNITANGGFSTSLMYKFKLQNEGMIEFSGLEVNPENAEINVNQGWNWISFLSQRTLDVNTALANFDAEVGDLIKSQFAFAIYEGDMIGWIGSLTNMVSGSGYMLKSAKTTSFKYPSVPLGARTDVDTDQIDLSPYLSNLDFGRYQSNMSVIAQTDVEIEGNNFLSIYNEEEKVGYGVPTEIDGKQYLFITVFGNINGDELKVMDELGNTFINADLSDFTFLTDFNLGTIDSPVQLISSRSDLLGVTVNGLSVFPNPFEGEISVSLPVGYQNLTYEIIDISGKIMLKGVMQQSEENQGVINTTELKGGLYFLKLMKNNELIHEHKILKY